MIDKDRLRLIALLNALEEGVLSAEGQREVVDALESSDEAQVLYIHYQGLVTSLAEYAREQSFISDTQGSEADCLQDDGLISLLALAEMEGSAAAQVVDIDKMDDAEQHQGDIRPPKSGSWAGVSIREFLSISGYLLRSPLVLKPAAAAALAAILVLAVVLLAPFTGSDKPLDPSPRPIAVMPVATLTAVEDAQWATLSGSFAPRVGDPLLAGDKLILATGYAELTTAQGAIAILEAPCVVELIDNDNALKLVSGKLVGVVETDKAKGFLVQTPNMDVIDRGTRFGIDASLSSSTEVHVFEGRVEVARPAAEGQSNTADRFLVLHQGEAVIAESVAGGFSAIQADSDRFTDIMPRTIPLRNTGFGLAAGQTDSRWQVVAIDGQPIGSPIPMVTSNHERYIEYLPSDPTHVQWVAWDVDQPVEVRTVYTLQTRLELPNDIDLATARIKLGYVADNHLMSLRVNGHAVSVPSAARDIDQVNNEDFTEEFNLVIKDALVNGPNTFEFDVISTGDQVGIRLQWGLHVGTDRKDTETWHSAVWTNPPQISGDIRYVRSMPLSLLEGESEHHGIQLYLERSAIRLADDIAVTLTQPGQYETFEGVADRVAAGVRFDSYFLHLDPPGVEQRDGAFRATLQFDRPILGVIASSDHLALSHETLGMPGVIYEEDDPHTDPVVKKTNGLERSNFIPNMIDKVVLSEDRKTLELELYSGIATDQLRVLVQSERVERN